MSLLPGSDVKVVTGKPSCNRPAHGAVLLKISQSNELKGSPSFCFVVLMSVTWNLVADLRIRRKNNQPVCRLRHGLSTGLPDPYRRHVTEAVAAW